MPTASQLEQTADALETLAGATIPANDNSSGQWLRIATAAEALAGAGSTANANETGYMLRSAVALEALAGTSGTEENVGRSGYLKRIVDALEVLAGAVTVGSLEGRMVVAAQNAEVGPPELVVNGTFDTDITGWSAWSTGVPSWEDGRMKVVVPTTDYVGARSDNIAVDPGTDYQLLLDVEAGSDVQVDVYDGSISASVATDTVPGSTSETVDLTFSSGAYSSLFIMIRGVGAAQTFYVDNASLKLA